MFLLYIDKRGTCFYYLLAIEQVQEKLIVYYIKDTSSNQHRKLPRQMQCILLVEPSLTR
ncbi:hypothetical protein BD560DRAFT_394087 [Blakeslea trispora]|nr:hypothetical protein BD560DRAFT_394087 [Blakeslea trispora]